MSMKYLALTGLLAACLPHANASDPAPQTGHRDAQPRAVADPYAKRFALIPAAAYPQLLAGVGGSGIRRVEEIARGEKQWLLVELRHQQLPTLRKVVATVVPHGGWASFATAQEARANAAADAVATHSSTAYTIDQDSVVSRWMAAVDEVRMRETISYLESSFTTRHARSTDGKKAAEGLKARWQALAAGRGDVTVELLPCSNCDGQPSVVLTVKAANPSPETVVLGAHFDTTVGVGGRSPGANENASGVAVLTETIRIALASGWLPRRDVVFVGYAAHDTGLNGSRALAQAFKAQGKQVAAVLDLDYTNYRASGAPAMRQISDDTAAGLNEFVRQLGAHYLPGAQMAASACGYVCGDHASWTAAGFPAAALTGSTWLPSNGTERDTLAALGNTAAPSVPFAQMALAFLAETAKGEIAHNPLPTAAYGYQANGLSVRFTDQSSGGPSAIRSWRWDFGDGTTSTERSPTHDYAKGGRYDVILRVVSDSGQDEEKKQIAVEGDAFDPVLENNQPVSGITGAAGSERFWTMNVPAGASAVKFATDGGSGDADLYVKRAGQPTPTSYDCRSDRVGNQEICELEAGGGGVFHVMLRGYRAYQGATLTGSYREQPGRTTYANENDLAIPDRGTAVESAVVVAGREGQADAAARVRVDIRHSYIGDLVVELLAADGTVYVLHDRAGGSADNLGADFTVDLSAEALNGTWKLRLRDMAQGDAGSLERWAITF